MAPDQSCEPGHYCPIACKEGMVMNQWEKGSTYTYPSSMHGGLYCDNDGNIQKPFPDRPNCVPGTGAVKAVNKCAKSVSFCQTVLPGMEDMLISTLVDSVSTLAVPGISYWESTSAHYYINAPGSTRADCRWGTDTLAVGNWAAYVAGANTDANGQTFVKLGINPVWQASNLFGSKPEYGVKIECPDGDCNGLPCEIHAGGGLLSNNAATGAGGADFCVVTVPKGKTAHIVAFDGSGGPAAIANNAAAEDTPKSTPSPTPSSTTHSSTPSPSPSPTPTSTSAHTTTSSSHTTITTPSSTTTEYPTVKPGIFHEETNSTSTYTSNSTYGASPTAPQSTPTTKGKKSEAGRQQGSTAIAGLVVALVAAACFY
ncbi:hypothetical protein NLG97_g41 [Lecanicillium saksenae]|uniref:Uncharacterized protein n=1 Tax=Lecanicillium saksenae TaxID=468837 RepID=A0ACC1R9E9_9HYPO|nr:hypothetical protein NLG97_g41 [Lecanicillium saksenae]